MYLHFTSKYSFVICMSLVYDFIINQIKNKLTRKCFSLAFLELIHIKIFCIYTLATNQRKMYLRFWGMFHKLGAGLTLKVCPNIIEVKPVITWLANGVILYRKKVI